MSYLNSSDPFFQDGQYSGLTTMELDGLTARLHMPRALESRMVGGVEVSHRLPPCNPRAAFPVDEYPGAPEDWMRSEPGTRSYMVPVKPEHGAWLDFNGNWGHTHDVAVVISTQGINAITGLKSDELRLEQYRDRCPKHDEPFVGNRRCNSCGYEWPAQNYIATTAAPRGYLWLDGFRTADGTTRQWVFTEDESRSVAKAVIGSERVHALGILFFLSREPKPVRPALPRLRSSNYGDAFLGLESMPTKGLATRGGGGGGMYGGSQFLESFSAKPRMEVAAGAKIDQTIHRDPKDLGHWSETPAGVIVINYTDEETLMRVLQSGTAGASEGFLSDADVPVGH